MLATTRADVNGVARRRLDVRKASFMPMDEAVAGTGMEYGGITPIGLPGDWPVLVDAAVAAADSVVIGSGVRRSKLRLPGRAAGRPARRRGRGRSRPVSAGVTIGVEEEFHLVDPRRRVPAEDAEQVVAAAAALGLEIEPELQRSQIEVSTGVCGTLPSCGSSW